MKIQPLSLNYNNYKNANINNREKGIYLSENCAADSYIPKNSNVIHPSFGGLHLKKLFSAVCSLPRIDFSVHQKPFVPSEEFAKLCLKDKTIAKKITPENAEIIKRLLEKGETLKKSSPDKTAKAGFSNFINAMAELSTQQLELCEKFTDMTNSALKSGTIKEAKTSIYNLFSIGKLFNTEEEINTVFSLLYSKKCNLDYNNSVLTIMDCLKSSAERKLISGFANGSHGKFESEEPVLMAAREINSFHKKHNRPMNSEELKIFDSYLDALKFRTEKDRLNYGGNYINDLISLTNTETQEDIKRLLMSNYKLYYNSGENGFQNGIAKLIKYKEASQINATSIIPYATRPHAQGRDFNDVKEFFEFFHANRNPLVKTIAINENLNAKQIKHIYAQLHENPELVSVFGRSLTEDNFEYMQFLATAVTKHPQLKEMITFQSNLPKDFIISKTDKFYNEQQNRILADNLSKLCDGRKIKAAEKLLSADEAINWAEILPKTLTREKAQIISDSIFEILSTRQRLDSVRYKNWSEWAVKAKTITDYTTCEIQAGNSFEHILKNLSENYASIFSKNNNQRGVMRSCGTLITPFGPIGAYSEYHSRFNALAETLRKSPYSDMELTQISGYVRDNKPTMAMIHPEGEVIKPALSHANEHYSKLIPYIQKRNAGNKLNISELSDASGEIATIHYILTNTVPFYRGSAGITGILTKSLKKAVGLPNTATQRNIALDLEAFCRPLEDYKNNWFTFFENRPDI